MFPIFHSRYDTISSSKSKQGGLKILILLSSNYKFSREDNIENVSSDLWSLETIVVRYCLLASHRNKVFGLRALMARIGSRNAKFG